MDKFAFIAHPIDMNQVHRFWPKLNFVPTALMKRMLKWITPFKISDIRKVQSIVGEEVEGYFIGCPLLPSQMLELDETFVLNKIIKAGKIAQDLGAKIVGLGGFTSVVGDKGVTIAQSLNIPVTTGNSYTVAAVIEGIIKASQIMQIQLSQTKAAVIGATGSIGRACARILAKHGVRLVITARNQERLDELASLIRQETSTTVEIEKNVRKAMFDADIVIVTTSAPEAIIDMADFKSGSVICDVAIPKNVVRRAGEGRSDILIFDGGLIRLPGVVNFGIDTELPDGLIYACIAEVMILTLEKRFESYSLGRNLSLDKIEGISNLASKHGLKVGEIEVGSLQYAG